MKAIYLLGEPGVGKTATLDAILAMGGWDVESEPTRLHGSLWGHHCWHGDVTGLLLGRHRLEFGGTDALAMNVSPFAIEWVHDAEMPDWVFAEGQRLSHLTFQKALAEKGDLTVILLHAAPEVVEQRIVERGSHQAEQWRRGAATRARRAFHRAVEAGLTVTTVSTDGRSPDAAAAEILALMEK